MPARRLAALNAGAGLRFSRSSSGCPQRLAASSSDFCLHTCHILVISPQTLVACPEQRPPAHSVHSTHAYEGTAPSWKLLARPRISSMVLPWLPPQRRSDLTYSFSSCFSSGNRVLCFNIESFHRVMPRCHLICYITHRCLLGTL